MNLGEITTLWREKMQETIEENSHWDNSEVRDTFINPALKEFAAQLPREILPTLVKEITNAVVGGKVTLPADYVDLIYMEDKDKKPVHIVGVEDKAKIRVSVYWEGITGEMNVTIEDGKFVIDPSTYADNITYLYIRNPVDLTISTSVPEIPLRLHRTLVYFAVAMGYEDLKEPEMAKYYNDMVQSKIAFEWEKLKETRRNNDL